MKENKKEDIAVPVLVVALFVTVFSSAVYIGCEESRYIEKRDAWFSERIKTALLHENSAVAVRGYYIPVKAEMKKGSEGKDFCSGEVDDAAARRSQQEAINSLYDRISLGK